ncbi:MAG: hypothetical protein JWR74_3218 [Polaromonas sp.]|nr:hypothetical protein [Polaromonas sp.]
MPTFTYHSAKAVVAEPALSGLVEVFFTGLLDSRSFATLQTAVMLHVSGAPAVVLHYDKAVVAVSQAQPIDSGAYLNAPVMAIVVGQDYVAMASAYATGLGYLGVIAAVFSDSAAQIRLAHQWASRHVPELRPRLLA